MSSEERLPKILITCHGKIPSVELGFILPFWELQKQGLCIFNYKDEMRLTSSDIFWCDILFVVRGASSQSVWAAALAKKFKRLVCGYWDDDFLSIPTHSLSYDYYASRTINENIKTLFKLSDHFFSPSPRLAAKLSSILGKDVPVLTGAQWVERREPVGKNRNHTPIVGFAGSRDHVAMLNTLIGPVITAVADARADFKVHVVGPKPDFIGMLRVDTIHTSYIQDYHDYLAFASTLEWDIGLAPQMDTEFTTYKFPNKLLEYAYIGCAGVYSKVEPYTSVIQDGITGLLVENEVPAWRDAIVRLLSDSELRLKISRNAYEYVRSNHNRDIVVTQYATVLEPLFKYRAPNVGRRVLWTYSVLDINGFRSRLYVENVKLYGIKRCILAALKRPIRLLSG